MEKRQIHRAYLLIGGNLGDRAERLAAARQALAERCGHLGAVSGIFETEAWGEEDQPSFYNQALLLLTDLDARSLMKALLSIESHLGRLRQRKYGPRTIDIDILFFDQVVMKEEALTLPHPRLQDRRFVLACLADIAPGLVHPVLGKTVARLLEDCPDPLLVTRIS